ncbi:zinc-binding alcohol dehydrogenase family protein [Okeania sp. SIO2B3]|uniref:quinone oxidoreductase family protein n=1 Tax=Okeania sp. SIO2B3 TaxID=2607784 RepID=UPI0013BF20ED|nr:zinc-binding alcohol dehydrogenase family protein [Okeania sp. SIO2B3]NET46473.1 zinc-binding alcohol dehydrogenase family protein [Okeania sp. SIO2B3]
MPPIRAIRFDNFGSPTTQLKLEELPTPVLQPGEVLVEVHAASINPSDVKNILGVMESTTLPRTPGRDFAGVVVAGAPNLIGTEVWGTGGDIGFIRDGSHASHLVLPVGAIQPKPQNISMIQAATIGVRYITAWLSLVEAANLQPGETVLVVGATGGVGKAAIQIAKWKGAKILGTVRRESDYPIVETSGVDIVINLATENLNSAVLNATGGKGVDVVLDTVGGSMLENSMWTLGHRGRLVAISAPPKEAKVCFDLRDFYHRELRLFGVDSRAFDVTQCGQILAALNPLFETNAILPPEAIATYPLRGGIIAYEQVHNRTNVSPLVLTTNM